jgi:SIR2-like domain
MANNLPPPYPEIYAELSAGRVIPFLGAGAPLYARNPTQTPWFQRRQGREAIDYLPTAAELADYLAARTAVPKGEQGELTKMAQYFEAVRGPQPLRKRLREIFSHEQPPTPLHEFLANVPAPLLIVTTNYDDLMERAFRAVGKAHDVVIHITTQEKVLWWPHDQNEPQEILTDELLLDLDKTPVVYKMHGAIDRRLDQVGQYVITEDDYIEFLTRMTRRSVIPPIFADPFQSRPFLFLGYGLYDWNLRVILNRIQEFRGHPQFRSWAIETLSKPVEQRLWNARGVDVYDGITLEQFLTELKKQDANDLPGAVSGGNQ